MIKTTINVDEDTANSFKRVTSLIHIEFNKILNQDQTTRFLLEVYNECPKEIKKRVSENFEYIKQD